MRIETCLIGYALPVPYVVLCKRYTPVVEVWPVLASINVLFIINMISWSECSHLRITAFLILLLLLCTGHPCNCSRLRWLNQGPSFARLLQQETNSGDSGYRAYTNARVITPGATKTPANRISYTSENAESTASSTFTGIHRLTAPADRRTYATVPATSGNDEKRDLTIKPRARSNIDYPAGGPKLGSGNDIEPIYVMGGMAYSQTYTGAKAVAATDAVAMSRGNTGKRRTDVTPIATSIWVNWIPPLKSAHTSAASRGSVGVSTAQRVGALAMSGASNGKIALAQADSAVAMAQTEKLAWYEKDFP